MGPIAGSTRNGSAGSSSWYLAQLAYRVPGDFVHELSIGGGVSHDGIPMQPHVGRPVFALQHQGLQTPALAERVIRGISQKVMHALLPYANLDSIDDGGHAPVELARHIDRKRISFDHGSRRLTIHEIPRRGRAAAGIIYAAASNVAHALATADT